MKTLPCESDRRKFPVVPVVASVFTMVVGALGLIGWVANIDTLRMIQPERGTMDVSTAACFFLAGLSLWLLRDEAAGRRVRRAGRLGAGIVAAVAVLTLAAYAGKAAIGIDNSLLQAGMDTVESSLKERMPWTTAFSFLLVGLALLGIDWRTRVGWRPSAALALLTTASGLTALVGNLYGVRSLDDFSSFLSMAAHTALGFVAMGIGIFRARAVTGPLGLLTADNLGGMVARRLLPFAIGVPLALGWLRLLNERMGFYGPDFGVALFALKDIFICSIFVWLAALWVNRSSAIVSESERRQRQLIESLPQLVWTCTGDGSCDYLSPQWVAYTGIPEATQLGYGWQEQIHPDDRERTIAGWKATAGVGLPVNLEFRIRRHDGVYGWFKTRAEPLRDAAGKIVKWFGTNTDITDQRLAEQARAKEEQRLRIIIDNLAEGIVIASQEGQLLYWNAASREIFGFRTVEEGFRHLHEFVDTFELWTLDGRLLPVTDWPLAQVIAGKHLREVELRLKRIGIDREFLLSFTGTMVHDADGNAHAFLAFADITERKRAEESLARLNHEQEQRVEARTAELSRAGVALQKTTDQLQMAQQISHVGSWEFDVASGRVRWSAELFRIVGRDAEQGAPNYEQQEAMFTPPSWSALQRAIAHALATGEGYELELEIIRPDGGRRWTIARAVATRGPGGAMEQLSGTLLDVTELRHTQTELERATERIRLAARAGELGIWDWSIADNRLVWDETMYRLYGIEEAQFSGAYEAWCGTVHPEDRAGAETALNDAVAGGADFDTVFRILRPDGTVRHIQASALVHRDATGKALHMVGINADITSQRESVLALRANEMLLREFVAHAPAAIAMMDRDVCYLQASGRWMTDYKLSGQDIIGRSHYEVFPDIPERWKQVHQRVLAGAVEFCDEDPFPRADGGTEWLQWEARPWRLGDGSIGGLIFFTQVITARKQLELDLLRQKQLLERSNRDLEQFAYVASHDLQEPLRAVTGCVQILQRRYAGQLDAGAEELIAHTVEGASRMQSLILDLLTYSRVGTKGNALALTDTAAALSQAMANLQTAIRETGATITVGSLPIVRGDPTQLAQLFQNLVGNALKYRGPRPPEIRIDAVRTADTWKFFVRDNGLGIEPQFFARIFVLFQRLHTRTEYPGTGIGLALCQKIVERHGGQIGVESALGCGSVFHFNLPA